jgi:hypothetical protein
MREGMMATDQPRRRPVIEVLYAQDCPHYRETLAMVERVRAELGVDAELRTTIRCHGQPLARALWT